MTQNIVELEAPEGKIRVTIGWDRPLKELFCNLVIISETEESTEAEEAPEFPVEFPRGLADIRDALKAQGLVVPEVLFTVTAEDKAANAGNIFRLYDTEGQLLNPDSTGA